MSTKPCKFDPIVALGAVNPNLFFVLLFFLLSAFLDNFFAPTVAVPVATAGAAILASGLSSLTGLFFTTGASTFGAVIVGAVGAGVSIFGVSAFTSGFFLNAFATAFVAFTAPFAKPPPIIVSAASVPIFFAKSPFVISPLSYAFFACHASYALQAAPPAHTAAGIRGKNSFRSLSPLLFISRTIPSSKYSTNLPSIITSPNSKPTMSPSCGICFISSNFILNPIYI